MSEIQTEARRIAEEAGIDYVEDRCLIIEQRRTGLTAHPVNVAASQAVERW